MALKGVSLWSCCSQAPQLGIANSHSVNSRWIVNLRGDFGKCHRWECCYLGVLAQRATNPVEDEKPTMPVVEISGASGGASENDPKRFHKDLYLLPSELYLFSVSYNELVQDLIRGGNNGNGKVKWHAFMGNNNAALNKDNGQEMRRNDIKMKSSSNYFMQPSC